MNLKKIKQCIDGYDTEELATTIAFHHELDTEQDNIITAYAMHKLETMTKRMQDYYMPSGHKNNLERLAKEYEEEEELIDYSSIELSKELTSQIKYNNQIKFELLEKIKDNKQLNKNKQVNVFINNLQMKQELEDIKEIINNLRQKKKELALSDSLGL